MKSLPIVPLQLCLKESKLNWPYSGYFVVVDQHQSAVFNLWSAELKLSDHFPNTDLSPVFYVGAARWRGRGRGRAPPHYMIGLTGPGSILPLSHTTASTNPSLCSLRSRIYSCLSTRHQGLTVLYTFYSSWWLRQHVTILSINIQPQRETKLSVMDIMYGYRYFSTSWIKI